MYLKPSLSSVLKLSICLTISQFTGLSAMAQTKAIADALKAKNSGQQVAQYRVQTKQVAEPGSTSSFNERVRGGAIIRKKQQLEILDIPNDGEFRYSIGLGGKYQKAKFEFKSDFGKFSSSSEEKGYLANTSYSYGLNEIFSINASIDYADTTSESKTVGSNFVDETNTSGVSDPKLAVVAKIESSSVTSILRLGAKIKSGDSESTKNEVSNEKNERNGNRLSGNSSVTPSILVHSNSNPNVIFGADLAYEIQNTQTTKYTNKKLGTISTTERTGGNIATLTLFNEYKVGTSTSLGGFFGFLRYEPTEYKDTNNKSEGLDLVNLSLYSIFKPSRSISIAPIFSYMTPLKRTFGEVSLEQYDDYTGTIRTTFNF